MTIKIKIDKIEKSDTYNGETVFKIEGSELNWNGRINVEYGYTNDNKLRIKCYNLTINSDSSVTGVEIQRSFEVIGRWETKARYPFCSEYDNFRAGFGSAADAKNNMIKYIQTWAKVEETTVEETTVEETTVETVETTQTNNQSTTEEPQQVTPQPTEPTMAQPTKIIVVTYHSYIQKWYSFTPENMESILLDFDNIVEIQIIEKGE